MAMLPGQRLGPYEVQSSIGAGGMGEVYRARDTRLDRIVAIKALPAHFADQPERRERFEREARTIASLNHPNICVLHDIGYQDGIDYLVMEYVEGETLASRLLKGPLPIDQVLRCGIEIADALDKAHRKGITHRDLKPANIMLTKSGSKLLDFGLAKLHPAPGFGLSALPTTNDAITAEGTILGTLQYMAPEQVEGREVDARADIFAFGAVVYEMVTGNRAFAGKSHASVMAKILEHDPPLMLSLQAMTPPALDRVVTRCLAKDPDDRWQTARDLGIELKWVAESGTQIVPEPPTSAKGMRSGTRQALIVGVGMLLLGAAAATLTTWSLTPAVKPGSVTRTVINLPAGQRLAVIQGRSILAFSPDGSLLAYVALEGNSQQLYLRPMNSLEARPVPGTEAALNPFFSPDGRWLGFIAGGKLKKVSLDGGAPIALADMADLLGSSWGSQGVIALGVVAGPLMQVSEAGGVPEALTPPPEAAGMVAGARWPEFLPGGRAVLFSVGTADFVQGEGVTYSTETRTQRSLLKGATHLSYVPPGFLTYAQNGNLMAAPFNLQTLEITGAGVSLVEGVTQSAGSGAAYFTTSTAGSLAYIPGRVETGRRRLVWVSRDGAEQTLAAPAQDYDFPQVSPDGQRIVVEVAQQLWLYDLTRDTLTRFTLEGTANDSPAWTRDGKRIVFRSNRDGRPSLFWQFADGSGGLEALGAGIPTGALGGIPRSWSPDDQLLAFHVSDPATQRDIWVLRLGDRKAEPFIKTPFTEGAPQFSPDGRWLAYVSNESGRPEVYVQPYPGPGGKWLVSTDGGTEPAWHHNGRELFFRSGMKMMSVEVTTQPTFSAGKPRMLFEKEYLRSEFPLIGMAYDVSPDGQRFLMIKETEPATFATATQIIVVQNWVEELKSRFGRN